MKSKNYRDSKKKHETLEKLYKKQADGIKFVVWSISDEKTLKEIREKFKVEEYDIIIKTRRFYDNKSLNNRLIHEINRLSIRQIHSMTLSYKLKTINTLKMNHVEFKTRYKIFLS